MRFKIFFLFIIYLFINTNLSSNNFIYNFNQINQNQNYIFAKSDVLDKSNYTYNYDSFNKNIKIEYFVNFNEYKYKKKEENIFRRAEILFFGSLTFATFGGWFFYSVYNAMIYDSTFGTIRREQFLPLYLGSSLISISVVFTDVFINIRPKLKKIEI